MDRILATHTGSLIRPPELLQFLAAKERGEPYDEAAYAKTLESRGGHRRAGRSRRASTSSTTARWARPAGSRYLYERISGVETRPISVEAERPAAEP